MFDSVRLDHIIHHETYGKSFYIRLPDIEQFFETEKELVETLEYLIKDHAEI
jgi:hypothetical protein